MAFDGIYQRTRYYSDCVTLISHHNYLLNKNLQFFGQEDILILFEYILLKPFFLEWVSNSLISVLMNWNLVLKKFQNAPQPLKNISS